MPTSCLLGAYFMLASAGTDRAKNTVINNRITALGIYVVARTVLVQPEKIQFAGKCHDVV